MSRWKRHTPPPGRFLPLRPIGAPRPAATTVQDSSGFGVTPKHSFLVRATRLCCRTPLCTATGTGAASVHPGGLPCRAGGPQRTAQLRTSELCCGATTQRMLCTRQRGKHEGCARHKRHKELPLSWHAAAYAAVPVPVVCGTLSEIESLNSAADAFWASPVRCSCTGARGLTALRGRYVCACKTSTPRLQRFWTAMP